MTSTPKETMSREKPMPLSEQVCSLELAKQLKELGVSQESLFKWRETYDPFSDRKMIEVAYGVKPFGLICSAFTASELGRLLPMEINVSKVKKQIYHFNTTRENEDWDVSYFDDNFDECINESAKTEANARAKMLIYLLKNKLVSL